VLNESPFAPGQGRLIISLHGECGLEIMQLLLKFCFTAQSGLRSEMEWQLMK
jgi:hypothetical protein